MHGKASILLNNLAYSWVSVLIFVSSHNKFKHLFSLSASSVIQPLTLPFICNAMLSSPPHLVIGLLSYIYILQFLGWDGIPTAFHARAKHATALPVPSKLNMRIWENNSRVCSISTILKLEGRTRKKKKKAEVQRLCWSSVGHKFTSCLQQCRGCPSHCAVMENTCCACICVVCTH